MQTIFYSWQSDSPPSTNRTFIGDCLKKAIKELRAEGLTHIDEAPDRDTQGVPGSPDIADTVFEKIDACSVFVVDVSFINGRKNPTKADCDCTRLTPNPNVLFEFGRATASVGFDRIITIFNEATGNIEKLPFDLRKRRVLSYRLIEGEDKAEQKKLLISKFKSALKEILELPQTALSLEFGDRGSETGLGTSIRLKGVNFRPLSDAEMPQVGGKAGGLADSLRGLRAISTAGSLFRTNDAYFLEKAEFLQVRRLARPFSFRVRNDGGRPLRNVRLEADISRLNGDDLELWLPSDLPTLPLKEYFSGHNLSHAASTARELGDLIFRRLGDRFRIDTDFGNLQPKKSSISQYLYIASKSSRSIAISVTLFADELSEPIETLLTIDFQCEQHEMTVADLRNQLPEEKELEERVQQEMRRKGI